MKFINLRGPNGAGKTTLLRCLARSPECRLVEVHQPLHLATDKGVKPEKVGTPKGRPIVATVTPDGLAILGDYTPAATGTTAGCDRISRQDDIKAALVATAAIPGVEVTLFEGIIVSTIFLPWLEWEQANGGMVWAFLDTPLEVCLKRIQDRNGGEPIKEDLVANKHKTIRDVRRKVLAVYPGGGRVHDIRWMFALKDIKELIAEVRPFVGIGADPGIEVGGTRHGRLGEPN